MGVGAQLRQLRSWREDAAAGKWSLDRGREHDMYEAVYRVAHPLVHSRAASCGTELYAVCEQYIGACVRLTKPKADSLAALRILSLRFGERSPRVGRLSSMVYEADGDVERATAVCDDLLKLHPTNGLLMKRKIAVLKTRGHRVEAIARLVDYLDVFMTDTEAWIELCELYRGVGR
jgi:hypothetical protein